MKIDYDAIVQASTRISAHINTTPVLTSSALDELTGAALFFKAEHLQKVGAFKARGAINAVLNLELSERVNGVATHSSGNHGAALARAAKIVGIPAYIVVPNNANEIKKAAILSYGGVVIECESTLEAREEMLAQVIDKHNAMPIPPYDHEDIIVGQGTAALELLRQVPSLTRLVIPVGGGGLLAGSSIAAMQTESIQVYGAEPAAADDAYRSFQSGIRVKSHTPDTIADGLRTTLGELNFEIIKDNVTDILLVTEEEITDAMKLLWTRLKQVVEPSAAVTLAAVIRYPEFFNNERVGIMLTGGNIDPDNLPF
jgi:threonine dehydratase